MKNKNAGCGCGCFTVLIAIVLVIFAVMAPNNNKKESGQPETTEVAVSTTQATEAAQETKTEVATTEEEIPIGKRNALQAAINYLDYTAFSKEGLRKQLEYEKYEDEDIEYAVENCGADWDEQAVKKAQSYLDYSSFSKDQLIEQLKYEGFTDEQAKHGADEAYK